MLANKLDITAFGGADLGGTGEVTSIPIAARWRCWCYHFASSRVEPHGSSDGSGQRCTLMAGGCVVDPVFAEILMDEDAKLVNRDYGGDGEVRNGKMPGIIRGFRVYKSNNLPYLGTGALGQRLPLALKPHFGVIVAGHDSAVATAQQIAKTETFRSPTTFADVVRGMQPLRSQDLAPRGPVFTANYNLA